MGFVIGFLTLVMVLDCVALVFLVLLQLPKKEAGVGLAFGGAATDALFGAGSGNVLTKVTKYAAAIFFVLAFGLSVMQSRYHHRTTSEFQKSLAQPANASGILPPTQASATPPASTPAPSTPAPAAATPAAPAAASNLLSAPAAEATNVPTPAAPK